MEIKNLPDEEMLEEMHSMNFVHYTMEFCPICDEAKTVAEKSLEALHHEVEFWNNLGMEDLFKFMVVDNLNAVIKYIQGFKNYLEFNKFNLDIKEKELMSQGCSLLIPVYMVDFVNNSKAIAEELPVLSSSLGSKFNKVDLTCYSEDNFELFMKVASEFNHLKQLCDTLTNEAINSNNLLMICFNNASFNEFKINSEEAA